MCGRFEKEEGGSRGEKVLRCPSIHMCKSVKLRLDEKKTFNQEMKLLSTLLHRGNSQMITNKNIENMDDQAINRLDAE